ncbi:hypothetical protein [Flavobacterium sp. HNIBRBA15423]|uniref:hypothetical protein n=1 Tax=Flavobacterium sp. HNIBRBA15423 TaxID=3458683 RepID=UPI004044A600
MDQRTQIATTVIANYLKEIMIDKKLTAYGLLKKAKENNISIEKQQLYSVLRMGKTPRPDYSITTFLKVLSLIGVHIEFHDLSEKSNLDLDKTSQN